MQGIPVLALMVGISSYLHGAKGDLHEVTIINLFSYEKYIITKVNDTN